MKSMVCPRCRGKLISEDDEVYTCPYCDYQEIDFDVRNRRLELEAERQKEEADRLAKLQREKDERRLQRTDPSGNTLIIHYTTNNPGVNMVVRLADSRQKDLMTNGQTLKFRLPPGQHVIVLKIGKINHNKTFIVPKSKEYVEINASWTGRPSIIVDQPEIEEELMTGQPATAGNQQAPSAAPVSAQAPAAAKPEKSWADMSLMERMFRKGTIPQWIIAGVLLLCVIMYFKASPLGAILILLGAAIISPALTEFLGEILSDSLRVPIKVVCFVIGGILAFIGACMATGKTVNSLYSSYSAQLTSERESSVTPLATPEVQSESEIGWSDLFGSDDKEQPVTTHVAMTEEDYKIGTGNTYAHMSSETNVYIAIPISEKVIKLEHWTRSLTIEREVKFDKDMGTFKIDDPENGFCWVDEAHTSFYFKVEDKYNSKLRKGKEVIFTVNVNDLDECKGTDYDEKIACYSFFNDDWHEYKAILLSDNLMKIEVWSKPNRLSDFIYNYDFLFINTEGGETDFEWGDDSHAAFTITLNDPDNSFYWKEDKFTSFVLKNKDYKYATVADYLGLNK